MSSKENNDEIYRANRKRRMCLLNERRQLKRRLNNSINESSTYQQQQGLVLRETQTEASTSHQPPENQINQKYTEENKTNLCTQKRKRQLKSNSEASTSRQQPKTQTNQKYPSTKYLYLGDPNYKCPYCDAIMWYDERVRTTSTSTTTHFNMCCRDGQVRLDKIRDPPEFLDKLLKGCRTKDGAMFKQHIRFYNSCYAFSSMGANIDNTINTIPGKYVFRISGQVMHRIGSLLPVDDTTPSFAQLYVYDTSTETTMREKTVGKKEGSPKLDQKILLGLKDMLDEVNPLAQTLRMAQERLKGEDDVPISIRLLGTREQKDRVYNAPTASEIIIRYFFGS